MVGKVSERVLLRQGLERTDNGMSQSNWPEVTAINQKNYYTDYMKRDDQILALRLQHDANRDKLVQNAKDKDRALARSGQAEVPIPIPELPLKEGPATTMATDLTEPADVTEAAHVIVIHPGSQNLRIGLASDALPKTVSMVLASLALHSESEVCEPLPVRLHDDVDGLDHQSDLDWSARFRKMCDDLKAEMRSNKRKLPPNPKEQVLNFNRRSEPEVIPQHNDPLQVDWTEIRPGRAVADGTYPHDANGPGTNGMNSMSGTAPPSSFIGLQAQRIPDLSTPRYRLRWPIRHGWLNEEDYETAEHLHNDFEMLLDRAIRLELGIHHTSAWRQYSCVFVVPDLHDKHYIEQVLRSCMVWFEFSRVCFLQESTAATFGAGYTQAVVVDVGAQKTAVTCVDDGLCIDDSRINLKYGGYDVTETLIKMLLYDNFPYHEINLRRRYDFLLAEELKIRHCSLNQAEVSPAGVHQFHVRAPDQPTHKYQFKCFDEPFLAAMGFYAPAIFDGSTKLRSRRKLIDRSYNAYDATLPDDASSAAQTDILTMIDPTVANAPTVAAPMAVPTPVPGGQGDVSTPMKDRSGPFAFQLREPLFNGNGTPTTSKAASPTPDGGGMGTHVPAAFIFGAARESGTPGPAGPPVPQPTSDVLATRSAEQQAAAQDAVLPVIPLDEAILTSVKHAARGDDKKERDLLGSIMVVGGGAKIPQFTAVLEERLRARRPDLLDRILVSRSARDMDEQVVVWKGASVFAKLPTNDSWITPFEYERLGARVLHHKVLWSL